MGTVVLDSSVLLGLLDPEGAHHVSAVALLRRLRQSTTTILVPVSVLAEVLVASARLGVDHVDRTELFVDALAAEVVVLDRRIARSAAVLRAKHPALRLPDALVIATGQARGADEVHTADKKWRTIDPRVQVLD
jgi:predicted nucleic acid-binding protein